MDNFTAKETWIDKLVDELVDAKNDLIEAETGCNQLYNLKEIIFNNVTLDYSGKSLRINNDDVILEYLRAIYPDSYDIALERLKEEAQKAREAELNTKEGSDNG